MEENEVTKWLWLLLGAFLLCCAALVAEAQPTTRRADYVLTGGQVMDAASGMAIGAYSMSMLGEQRSFGGRVVVFLLATGWGDKLWVAAQVGPPGRGDDGWQEAAVIETGDSVWAPLSGRCVVRQEDGGRWRVAVTLYFVGGL